MKSHAFRLHPQEDLRTSIESRVRQNQIQAGVVLSAVGSLSCAVLRLADGSVKTFKQNFEIVSLIGTVSVEECHLHISLADDQGQVIGGHVKPGCKIYTTGEIVLVQIQDLVFSREDDDTTGYKELVITQRSNK